MKVLVKMLLVFESAALREKYIMSPANHQMMLQHGCQFSIPLIIILYQTSHLIC